MTRKMWLPAMAGMKHRNTAGTRSNAAGGSHAKQPYEKLRGEKENRDVRAVRVTLTDNQCLEEERCVRKGNH